MADPRRRTRPDPLLRTKLMPPRLPPGLLVRPALLARLDRGLPKKLTLVAAATGYGKSTLVAQWLAGRPEPVAWVALDRGDDDPVRFWTYVIAACQQFAPDAGKDALAALRTSQQPAFEPLIASFINDLSTLPGPNILVLEDYHVVASPTIHAGVTFLLEHLPPSIHLVILTRTEPPLALPRLRAHNQVNELAAADLRFTADETRSFLQGALPAPLKPETVARLDARNEGWPAGLRLVVLALEGKRNPEAIDDFVASFSGGHRHVSEYLAGEVLAGQPEPVQDFLLQTGILDRLTPSLCDSLTGRDDAATLLAQIEAANLFIQPLREEGGRAWYRYHALFAEALRRAARERFGEAGMAELYGRTSGWYEGHGLLELAIDPALAAREYDRAAGLIEAALDWRARRELHTVRRWLEQLPPDVLAGRPSLNFEYALALLFTSDRFAPTTAARIEPPLAAAEAAWRRAGNDASLGQVLGLRSMVSLWQARLDDTYRYARESLALLPEHDLFWRSSDLIVAGIEELGAGRVDTAQDVLIEARALAGACQSPQGQLAATGLLADAYLRQGEFDQARLLYQQVRDEAAGSDDMLDDQAAAGLGFSALAYERNDLPTAEKEAQLALDLSRQRSYDFLAVQAAPMLARVLHARGQTAQAQEVLAVQLAHTSHPALVPQLLAWQARLAFVAGAVDEARRWQAGLAIRSARGQNGPEGPRELGPSLREFRDLLIARLLLADGDHAAALTLLEPWRDDGRAHGRASSELEASLLIAAAHSARGDPDQAAKALLRALTIGQSKGYLRTFVDEGEPVRRLIAAHRPQIDTAAPRLKAYVYRLLGAFSPPAGAAATSDRAPGQPALPFEPLSQQEQRVLRLLAAGLSNPEIARELVVSTNTVKTQIQSIYRKLNVNSRSEAAEVARSLKLV